MVVELLFSEVVKWEVVNMFVLLVGIDIDNVIIDVLLL